MLRYLSLVLLFLQPFGSDAQRLITRDESVQLAIGNQRNLRAGSLSVRQQQELLNAAGSLENPEVFVEASPYEAPVVGAAQTFNLPGVNKARKGLQKERIRVAQLQLQGSQYELKKEVQLLYLQLQYLIERERLLRYQDSIYQAIKTASKRFFDAGQINKLEELQATTQADAVRNDLLRVRADLQGETEIFRFYTGYADTLITEPVSIYVFTPIPDTAVLNFRQQILKQELAIGEAALKAERADLLPKVRAGLLFPTSKDYERPIGFELGVSIPIWRSVNRSRVAAAKSGLEIAQAEYELEQQRLAADIRSSVASYRKEMQSLEYYNTVALPQARSIIETSQRLFHGGELNYIESLRNLDMAFDIYFLHLETHRAYNEAVINLNYLNGTL
jgi:outer membrane protein, heavy metal efflux system